MIRAMTTDEITLRVPAASRFVATIRVTTTSLAAELDFSVDEIDELRMGVNELAAVLVDRAEEDSDAWIELVYRLDDASLEIEAALTGLPAEVADDALPDVDVLATQILGAVVDEHHLNGTHGRIVKRRDRA